MNINKHTCVILRRELTKAMTEVLQRYDMSVEMGNIRFDEGVQFRFRTTVYQNKPVVQPNAFLPSLTPLTPGETIMFNGRPYKYVGPGNGHKYKHRVTGLNGKTYKMTDAMVQQGRKLPTGG